MKILFFRLMYNPIFTGGNGEVKDVYETKSCDISNDLSFKDIDGRKGIATGYIANFNTLDSDGDVIKPGAFKKSLSESGPGSVKPRIKYILNHDWNQPIGVFTVLQEDAKGLYYESQVGTHAGGVDFIKMVDSGLITEHSFGYRTIKYNQVTPWQDMTPEKVARELTELKMYEGSPLSCLAANKNTPFLGLKSSMTPDKLAKRFDLIVKSLRVGTITDETCELLEIELKQIQQLYISLSKEPLKSTSEPPKNTQKANRSFAGLVDLL